MRVPGARGRAALLLWVLAAVATGPGRAPGGEGPPPAAAAEAGAGGGLAYAGKGAELTPADVLDHGRRATGDPGAKGFAGPVLGYVTPWNARGYEVAERYDVMNDLMSGGMHRCCDLDPPPTTHMPLLL